MTTLEHLIKAGERLSAALDALEIPGSDAWDEINAAQRDWEHYLLRYQTETAARITPPETIEALTACRFLTTEDPELQRLLEKLPRKHWARYDLSAVRLGWEARKLLHPETPAHP